jgi:archaellum component FlaC
MIEKKTKSTLDKIEGLILDGNKEIIDRIENKLEAAKHELRQEINGAKQELKQEINGAKQELKQEIKEVDRKVEMYYKMLDYDIKEVDKKVGEAKEKLEEHARLPHPV